MYNVCEQILKYLNCPHFFSVALARQKVLESPHKRGTSKHELPLGTKKKYIQKTVLFRKKFEMFQTISASKV